jgi:ceramide glucosyltransferase
VSPLVALPVVFCTLWVVLGLLAIRKVTRGREVTRGRSATHRAGAPSAVTILKPLAGADPSLAENLASFFEQAGVRFEIVFGVARSDDASLPIVAALMARYPKVPARVVITGEGRGHNPKVRNLRGMMPHAQNDICLISDSNVRAPRHYAREAVLRKTEGVGVVSHLFAGRGGAGLGATLEIVELAGFCAAGVALPTLVGEASLVGKSILFSRAEFERFGGFDEVEDVLAEDYVMGQMYAAHGMRVVLAPTVLDNMVGTPAVRTFFDRHLRWSMMRFRLRPFWFWCEPLTSPLAVAPFAWAAFGGWGLVHVAAIALLRDVAGYLMLNGPRGLLRVPLGTLAREISFLAIFLTTPLKRHVAWRGHRMRLGPKTTLVPA